MFSEKTSKLHNCLPLHTVAGKYITGIYIIVLVITVTSFIVYYVTKSRRRIFYAEQTFRSHSDGGSGSHQSDHNHNDSHNDNDNHSDNNHHHYNNNHHHHQQRLVGFHNPLEFPSAIYSHDLI